MPKFLAVVLLGLLAVEGNINTYSSPVTRVDSSTIGPYDEFQDDEEVTFNYKIKANLEVYEEMKFYDGATGRTYERSKKATHTSTTLFQKIKFVAPLKKYFSKNGMTFEFTIYSSTNEIFYTTCVTLFPRERKSFNVTKDKVKSIVSNNVSFKITNNEMTLYQDSFNFVNFKDYIDADNYYQIDLRKNTFLYNYSKVSFDSATLTIDDPKKVFKLLPHTNGKVILDMSIASVTNEIKNFRLKNSIYVDRLTLDVCNYKYKDYEVSRTLYLPINRKKDFVGSTLRIDLLGCGYNKYDFTFDLTYDVSRNLIGSCHNSDYCIKGEIS